MSRISFDRLLQVRTPNFLFEAIDVAARRRASRPAEYVRQALLTALRTDGIEMPELGAGAVSPAERSA